VYFLSVVDIKINSSISASAKTPGKDLQRPELRSHFAGAKAHRFTTPH
jgi:hypothetical protein